MKPFDNTSANHDAPGLHRPGAGAHNHIAGSAQEQLARARQGRRPEPLPEPEARRLAATFRAYPELFTPVLAALLTEDLARAIARALHAALGRKRRTS